jgi:hypothetical protein
MKIDEHIIVTLLTNKYLKRLVIVFQLFMEDHLYPVVSTNKTVTKSLRYR